MPVMYLKWHCNEELSRALHPNDKNFRAIYRFSKWDSIMQDLSFYEILKIDATGFGDVWVSQSAILGLLKPFLSAQKLTELSQHEVWAGHRSVENIFFMSDRKSGAAKEILAYAMVGIWTVDHDKKQASLVLMMHPEPSMPKESPRKQFVAMLLEASKQSDKLRVRLFKNRCNCFFLQGPVCLERLSKMLAQMGSDTAYEALLEVF